MKKPLTETTAKTAKAKTANVKVVTRGLLLEAARMLEDAPSWVIFTHSKPDGDAAGCSAALFEAGLNLGKRVSWVGTDEVPPGLCFLPHAQDCVIQKKYNFDGADDLYIFLDAANEDRSVEGLKEKSPEAVVLNIDHHEDNAGYGVLNCVDAGAAATAEVLWRMMTEAGWPITPPIAECLYTALVTDTGWFAYSNTTPATHMMAADLLGKGVDPTKIDSCVRHTRSLEGARLWALALMRIFRWGPSSQFAMTWLTRKDFEAVNAAPSDTAMLVNQLIMIKGVKFAVLLTEDGTGHIKGNVRSQAETVTAASVARALGGGGHPRAAGFNVALNMAAAVKKVQKTVDKKYAEWTLADR